MQFSVRGAKGGSLGNKSGDFFFPSIAPVSISKPI